MNETKKLTYKEWRAKKIEKFKNEKNQNKGSEKKKEILEQIKQKREEIKKLREQIKNIKSTKVQRPILTIETYAQKYLVEGEEV